MNSNVRNEQPFWATLIVCLNLLAPTNAPVPETNTLSWFFAGHLECV